MMAEISFIDRCVKFITEDIWSLEISTLSRIRRFLIRQVKILYIVFRGFLKDSCPLRASALTYTTLLAAVPLLAFAFSMASGFGMVLAPLKKFLIDNIALGNEEIGNRMFQFVENIKVGTLGPLALGLLVITIISVMGNIELSFNRIWGVQRSRSIWRKFSDYLSVLVVCPLLILAGVAMATSLKSHKLFTILMRHEIFQMVLQHLFKWLSWIFTCLGFMFLYIFMPNTRVRLKAALIGGLFAGLIWVVALWGYVSFQVGFLKYAKIYGALASIPINLVWIYISWLIVLFGAEISFAVQNVRTYQREESALSRSWAYQELVALNILERIGRNFLRGASAGNAEIFSRELNVPIRLVNQLLQKMAEGGLINEVAGEEHAFQPARNLNRLTVKKVLDVLRFSGGPGEIPANLKQSPLVIRIESRLEKAFEETGGNLTLEELLEGKTEVIGIRPKIV